MLGGTDETKQEYLGRLSEAPLVASFALTESGAGSDVAGIRTTAVRRGDKYVINGSKVFITNGGHADWYTVFAKTSSDVTDRTHDSVTAFIVERWWDGVSVGSVDRKMGVRGVDTGELLLEDVHVPAENVIGEVGGFRLAMLGLNSMRPIVAARGIGLAEGALMYATEYAQQRAMFTRTEADFQGVQWEIAKLATEIEAARLLTYRSAWMADRGEFHKEHVPYLSMAKYYATEVAVRASNVCLQLLGAAGYMKDHPMELYYRDAKQLTIVEGTSQIQLGLIARGVLDGDLWWD
jgi:alkylation response protein AidB-like acyl-CoA dehydrogenase